MDNAAEGRSWSGKIVAAPDVPSCGNQHRNQFRFRALRGPTIPHVAQAADWLPGDGFEPPTNGLTGPVIFGKHCSGPLTFDRTVYSLAPRPGISGFDA
jgi:hypothetical protein